MDFTILLSGDVTVTERLKEQIKGTRVIAADGGIVHAKTLGVIPELWVGDFDSCAASHLEEYAHIPRLTFNRDKDKTDGEIALNKALEAGAKRIVFCGAFGGARTDHALAHINIAIDQKEKGVFILLTSGHEEAFALCDEEQEMVLAPRTLFSILGHTDFKGLTIKGARWNLDDVDVSYGRAGMVSNEAEGTIKVRLRSGRGIVMASLLT